MLISKSLFCDKRVKKTFLYLSENEKITDSLQWPKFPVYFLYLRKWDDARERHFESNSLIEIFHLPDDCVC